MKKSKIIIGIILLLGILAGGFFYLKGMSQSNTTNLSGYVLGSGVAPDLTPEEIQALMQKKVDESKVAFSIYTEPTFKGKRGTIMFANPRYSAHNIELEVILNNKVIMNSKNSSRSIY